MQKSLQFSYQQNIKRVEIISLAVYQKKMSVTDIKMNTQIQSVSDLHKNLKYSFLKQIHKLQVDTAHNFLELSDRMIHEITIRDDQIFHLSADNEQLKTLKIYLGDKYPQISLSRKIEQLWKENKEYETQFINLMSQMKQIKIYVQQLKKMNSNKDNKQQNSPVHELCLEEQDKILSKISSLNRLQKIDIKTYLDTIKQVTELSARSDQDNSNLILQQNHPVNPFTIDSRLCQSFQCPSQIYENSRNNLIQDFQNWPSKLNETLEQSLSVLKNFPENLHTQKISSNLVQLIQIQLPSLKQLVCPTLFLREALNNRHLLYLEGYVYTGETAILAGQLKPMGFGQLYYKNKLLYCGQWKNGAFDGWGKMHFQKGDKLRLFNGRWQSGRPSGPCTLKFSNNQKYIGSLSGQLAQGQGTLFSETGPLAGIWEQNRLIKCTN